MLKGTEALSAARDGMPQHHEARGVMRESTKVEIIGLDYLRLCSAFMVMAYHFLYFNRFTPNPLRIEALSSNNESRAYFSFGWVGVELFFVISGYVISLSASNKGALSFAIGRFLRLAPGIWICSTIELLAFASLFSSSRSELTMQWVRTVVFWPRGQIDGVYWTLQIEISFYLIVLLMINAGIKKFIEATLVFLGLCSGLFWAVEIFSIGPLHSVLADKGEGLILRSTLITHGCFFAIGVSLFRGFNERFSKSRLLCLFALTICCLTEIKAHCLWMSEALHLQVSAMEACAAFLSGVTATCFSIIYNDRIESYLGRRNIAATRVLGRVTFPL